jgi:type IV pilus assembly protein PilB
MTQRRTLGEILVGLGRITEADVAKALEYQRQGGGYIGEALIACGVVSEKEIEWSLASQSDLPYVFPKAEEIDYDAASLVSPEWALANLTLPIMRTARTLTVVIDSPIRTTIVEELRTRTDLEIDLALASPSKIRELIRQVYARASAADEDVRRPPVGMSDALDMVITAGAARFGVSVRGSRASVWWDEGGSIRRHPLSGDWEGELERMLRPSLETMTRDRPRRDWLGELVRVGMVTAVDVHFLADESGREYLFHPRAAPAVKQVTYPPPAGGILSEVRLLARSGTARFVFTAAPPELGREMLPHLPELFLDPSWRSIYVHSRDPSVASEVFSHRLAEDRGTWRAEIDSLLSFQFDAVTVDLAGGEADWAPSAISLGSVAFLLWADGADVGPAYDAGIRWHLHVLRRGDGQVDWSLEPLPSTRV